MPLAFTQEDFLIIIFVFPALHPKIFLSSTAIL